MRLEPDRQWPNPPQSLARRLVGKAVGKGKRALPESRTVLPDAARLERAPQAPHAGHHSRTQVLKDVSSQTAGASPGVPALFCERP